MKLRILQRLTIALVGTLAVYFLIKPEIFKKFSFSNLLRFLSAEETNREINEICSKSPSNLVEFYKNNGQDYVFIPPKGNLDFTDIAKSLISNSSSMKSDMQYFFFINPTTIFILVLFILLVILWFPFICCVCFKKCLCVPKILLKHSKYFTIGCILLCLAICITCLVGYFKNSNILHGIFGLGCSVLKIGFHLIDGDEYKVKPYWSGITSITDKLNNTKTNIVNLLEITANMNKEIILVNQKFTKLENDLDNEYNIRYKELVDNPEPGEESFIPEYLELYGPPNVEGTTLGGIKNELDIYMPYTLGIFRSILNTIDLGENTTNSIVEFLNDITNNLDKNIKGIDKQIGGYINSFDMTLDSLDTFSRSIMNLIFSINLALVIAIIISLILIFFFKRGHCLLCCSWSLLYLFLLLTLVIGAIFLVVGLFVQNLASGIITFIHSINDLKSGEESDIAIDIVDNCFNRDGLLFHSNVFPKQFNITVVEAIYDLELSLKEEINDLNNYNFSSISAADVLYNDIQLRPKKYIEKLKISLNKVQEYIDFSSVDTKVSVDTPIYDEWEISIEDCKEEYKYLPKNELNLRRLMEEDKYCLVITEWSLEDIKKRYKNIKSIDNVTDIGEYVEIYYNSLNAFITSNNLLISDIKKQNSYFNDSFISIRENAVGLINNILKFVKPFREGYKEIVGDGSIFEILNCGFLKRDFNKLFEELYVEFGSSFRSTSDLLLTICVFEFIMTLLMLFIVASLKKNKDEDTYNLSGSLIDGEKEKKVTELN